MERIEMSKKGLYIGTGIGLILFVLVGFLSGSLIGGMAGLKIMGLISGAAIETTLLSRIVVAASMIVGVVVSAVLFIGGMAALGWTAGFLFESSKKTKLSGSTDHAATKTS
jgi:hypothetical protein